MSPRTTLIAAGLWAALTVAAVGTAASADAAADARKATAAIKAAYAKQSTAFMKNDVAGYSATHDPSYTMVDQKGRKHTLKEAASFIPTIQKMAQNVKHVYTLGKITVSGGKATAQVTESLTGNVANPHTKIQVPHRLERTEQDTWVLTKGAWKRSSTKTLTESHTIDGVKVSG